MKYKEWKKRVFEIAEKIYPGEGKKMVESSEEDCMIEAYEDDVSPGDFFREGYCEE